MKTAAALLVQRYCYHVDVGNVTVNFLDKINDGLIVPIAVVTRHRTRQFYKKILRDRRAGGFQVQRISITIQQGNAPCKYNASRAYFRFKLVINLV